VWVTEIEPGDAVARAGEEVVYTVVVLVRILDVQTLLSGKRLALSPDPQQL
jgi:hypothetical protein